MTAVARVGRALFLRDMRIALSYRAGFALTTFGAVVNTLAIYFLSEAFGNVAAPAIAPYGNAYFGFAIIGVALTNLMAVGMSGMSGRIREGQMTGTLEIMLMSPNRLAVLLIGSTLWSHLLAVITMIPYAIAAVLLGLDVTRVNLPVAILSFVLAVVSFNALGLLAASFVILIKSGDPVTWVVSTASVLLAGVFYPTSVLPDWMQVLGRLLPLTYALELLRGSLLRGEGFATLGPAFVGLAILTVLLLGIGLVATRQAIRIALRDGSLSYY